MRAPARALLAVPLAIAVAALAGCSTTGSRATSAVSATGNTLTVYLSVPPGASADPAAQDLIDAEQLACRHDQGEISSYTVRCVPVHGNTLSANARTAIQNAGAIAYVGEASPGTSQNSVGITNALDLLEVSPTDGALELTRSTPAVAGAPSRYYQSWSSYGRTFAHVVPSTGQEALALVAAIRAAHVTSVYVNHDSSDYGAAIARAMLADAPPAIAIASSQSGAGAIFYGSDSPSQAAQFFNHAAQSNPSARLYGPAALGVPAFVRALSPQAARAVRISTPGFPTPPPRARSQFVLPFVSAYGHRPAPSAIYGYAAVDALFGVLRAAGANATNRALIVHDFLKLHDPNSVLGNLSIQSDGDTTPSSFVINRVSGGRLVAVAPAS
jgi:ABC-type branched-subunit amino acid transport system substrate-binding protein